MSRPSPITLTTRPPWRAISRSRICSRRSLSSDKVPALSRSTSRLTRPSPAARARDLALEDLLAALLEQRQGSGFVALHKSTDADNVRREDRDEAPLNR